MTWPLIVAVALGLLVLLAAVYFNRVPPNMSGLAAHPRPAADYAEAVRRVTALRAREASGHHNPLCHTQLLTHGQKAARAIAFIHGYTNCPHQFLRLGQQFYALGYNVLLVPMPHQGLADHMTNELSQITAEEMAAYADQLVDIGRGLGDWVAVAGLSQGGVIAGWAAQTRADLDLAVLIAPGFGVNPVPPRLTVLVTRLALALPDVYLWWDTLVRFGAAPPPPGPQAVQGYPRFSIHGLAQQFRLGFATQARARQAPPAARAILVVTNGADLAVQNSLTDKLVAEWRAHGAAGVVRYCYPASLRISHDMIDPNRDDQKVDVVYPKLIELINGT